MFAAAGVFGAIAPNTVLVRVSSPRSGMEEAATCAKAGGFCNAASCGELGRENIFGGSPNNGPVLMRGLLISGILTDSVEERRGIRGEP